MIVSNRFLIIIHDSFIINVSIPNDYHDAFPCHHIYELNLGYCFHQSTFHFDHYYYYYYQWPNDFILSIHNYFRLGDLPKQHFSEQTTNKKTVFNSRIAFSSFITSTTLIPTLKLCLFWSPEANSRTFFINISLNSPPITLFNISNL